MPDAEQPRPVDDGSPEPESAIPAVRSDQMVPEPHGAGVPLSSEQIIQTVETVIRESFAGPLPPPDVLRLYEECSPGLASKLVTMAQEEGQHRRSLEKAQVEAQIDAMRRSFTEARWGQICGLTFGIVALVTGGYTAVHGAQIAGGFIGVGGISTIITAFIYGRKHPRGSEGEAKLEQPKQDTPKT